MEITLNDMERASRKFWKLYEITGMKVFAFLSWLCLDVAGETPNYGGYGQDENSIYFIAKN